MNSAAQPSSGIYAPFQPFVHIPRKVLTARLLQIIKAFTKYEREVNRKATQPIDRNLEAALKRKPSRKQRLTSSEWTPAQLNTLLTAIGRFGIPVMKDSQYDWKHFVRQSQLEKTPAQVEALYWRLMRRCLFATEGKMVNQSSDPRLDTYVNQMCSTRAQAELILAHINFWKALAWVIQVSQRCPLVWSAVVVVDYAPALPYWWIPRHHDIVSTVTSS